MTPKSYVDRNGTSWESLEAYGRYLAEKEANKKDPPWGWIILGIIILIGMLSLANKNVVPMPSCSQVVSGPCQDIEYTTNPW